MTFDFKSTHVHNLIYFFSSGHGNEFCNLIGFKRSPDFPFSDYGHSNACMTFFRELTKSFEREEKNKKVIYRLRSVRIVKNCDLRPRAAFSRPRSQFFTIWTSQSANNIYLSIAFIL